MPDLSPDLSPDEQATPEPRGLRNLRRLVTLLTISLIIAALAMAGLAIYKLIEFDAADPLALQFPPGFTAEHMIARADELMVIGQDDKGEMLLLIYPESGGEAPKRIFSLVEITASE